MRDNSRTIRVCPKCDSQSMTPDGFCKDCGTESVLETIEPRNKKLKIAVAIIIFLVFLAVSPFVLMWSNLLRPHLH